MVDINWAVDFDLWLDESGDVSWDDLQEDSQEHIIDSIRDDYYFGELVELSDSDTEDYGSWSVTFDITIDGQDASWDDLSESAKDTILNRISEDYFSGTFEDYAIIESVVKENIDIGDNIYEIGYYDSLGYYRVDEHFRAASISDVIEIFNEEYPNCDINHIYDPISEETYDAEGNIIGESLHEDTVKKSNGKWTNRGDTGKEHGTFKAKKVADAQRKAMYANGYKGENLKEDTSKMESLHKTYDLSESVMEETFVEKVYILYDEVENLFNYVDDVEKERVDYDKKKINQLVDFVKFAIEQLVQVAKMSNNTNESIVEDTVKKSNGKWVNRGDDGTEHGEFRTKKAADAQRKAMFARGYKG